MSKDLRQICQFYLVYGNLTDSVCQMSENGLESITRKKR